MRLDSFSAKTWLLAGAAGWAICLWVLAIAGMGHRIGETTMPTDQQKLPTTTMPAAERPGPLSQYTEIAARPIFAQNRRPQKFFIGGEGEKAQSNAFDYTLTSVLISPQVRLAIVKSSADNAQPVRVKLGEALETAPQWILAELRPRSAVFRGPEGERALELRVYDGVGGAVPQPVVTATAPVINESPSQSASNDPPPGPNSAPEVLPPPPPPPVATTPATPAAPSTQAQLENIRKRIEARRAQLRQQNQTPQNNNVAAPQPGQIP